MRNVIQFALLEEEGKQDHKVYGIVCWISQSYILIALLIPHLIYFKFSSWTLARVNDYKESDLNLLDVLISIHLKLIS